MAPYRDADLDIIDDIWRKNVTKINDKYYLTAGDWAPKEKFPAIHVGYLAPNAYALFAQVDAEPGFHSALFSAESDCALRYKNKTIYILDESHRYAVQGLANDFGAEYIKGRAITPRPAT